MMIRSGFSMDWNLLPLRLLFVRVSLAVLIAFLMTSPLLIGQYAERSSLCGSGEPDIDASGRSVKNPRVRAIHSDDGNDTGSSAYFIRRDPYLAYQLGRNLNYREFRTRDGIFDRSIAGFGGPMVDPTCAKITTNNQTSCLGCHNLPPGNPGGGTNFAKDSGFGRNAPHYYGAGLMEMLGIQIRAEIMAQLDTDGDGWISVAESSAGPDPVVVYPGAAEAPIDFGNPGLTGGTTGIPRFNHIIRVWYGGDVGGTIQVVPGATEIDGNLTTHYNFAVVIWGWGQRVPPSALNPTNRAFIWDPIKVHSGLESYDPSTTDDPDGDGVSLPTLAGAIQFPATHRAPDEGNVLHPFGFSQDDPDGDGYLTEISEGDLDLGEWFMLNAPKPSFAGTRKQFGQGIQLMRKTGCAECHVTDWRIRKQDTIFEGDRRSFDFDVTWNEQAERLEGRLIELCDKIGQDYIPRREDYLVEGLFTDFRHHYMGEGFFEKAYDGHINAEWRTAPLWGVGSSFPWGHDGQSLTLKHVILRHGGEAEVSRERFESLDVKKQNQIITFLRALQLYDIESPPADIDGDDLISDHYHVAGVDTGIERFNAEWLFEIPVKIQGKTPSSTPFGPIEVNSFAATNLEDAYGLLLPFRIDSDLDGWPDAWDVAPLMPGYKDGLNN